MQHNTQQDTLILFLLAVLSKDTTASDKYTRSKPAAQDVSLNFGFLPTCSVSLALLIYFGKHLFLKTLYS